MLVVRLVVLRGWHCCRARLSSLQPQSWLPSQTHAACHSYRPASLSLPARATPWAAQKRHHSPARSCERLRVRPFGCMGRWPEAHARGGSCLARCSFRLPPPAHAAVPTPAGTSMPTCILVRVWRCGREAASVGQVLPGMGLSRRGLSLRRVPRQEVCGDCGHGQHHDICALLHLRQWLRAQPPGLCVRP